MTTFFTIPKPFIGHINTIQRNAIKSWLQLEPKCEIILFGDETGISDVASELAIVQIPEIDKNECGTPLLDCAFQKAQEIATSEDICYINTDIILLSSFSKAKRYNNFNKYLIIGQRIDLDIFDEIHFDTDRMWETRLLNNIRHEGNFHGFWGIDYFIFPKGLLKSLPPFAVGRAGWDNWMIYHVKKELNVPVIDASKIIVAIHQNHDYSHVPLQKGRKYEGFESDRNFAYIGRKDHSYNILDANFILTEKGVKKNPITLRYLRQVFIDRPVASPFGQKIDKFRDILSK